MIPKKLFLFSASLLLLTCASGFAQQPAPATPPAPATRPVAPAPRVNITPAIAGFARDDGNYLGITAQEVTRENMGSYNLREPRGVVITRVVEKSPAERAGLRKGDVILRFDGENVTSFRKLQRLISEATPQQSVRLTISRNGNEQELSVTFDRRERGMGAFGNVWGTEQREQLERGLDQARAYGKAYGGAYGFGWGRRIGVSTTQLTKQLADYFGINDGRGVLVTSVSEGSPAARAGIRAGDVITAVDGEKIESSGDLARTINRKAEGDVSLSVVRDRNQRTVKVTPEKREPSSFNVTPEAFEFDTEVIQFEMPNIDIRIPPFKMKQFPRIEIPKIKIKPEQLKKLETLMIL